jgi:hypothetical protein
MLEPAAVKEIIDNILDAELPLAYFDGIFVSNFLEHLPNQDCIGAALAKLRASMEPGGTLAVLGPNFRYCSGRYFDYADHTLALTYVAVAEHMYACGFEVTAVIPCFLPYSFCGLLPPSPNLTRIYLRVPALWRVSGKQFLVLGVRSGTAPRRDQLAAVNWLSERCPDGNARATNWSADTKGWVGQAAYIDAAHWVHARVEDAICIGRDCGIGHFLSFDLGINSCDDRADPARLAQDLGSGRRPGQKPSPRRCGARYTPPADWSAADGNGA